MLFCPTCSGDNECWSSDKFSLLICDMGNHLLHRTLKAKMGNLYLNPWRLWSTVGLSDSTQKMDLFSPKHFHRHYAFPFSWNALPCCIQSYLGLALTGFIVLPNTPVFLKHVCSFFFFNSFISHTSVGCTGLSGGDSTGPMSILPRTSPKGPSVPADMQPHQNRLDGLEGKRAEPDWALGSPRAHNELLVKLH